MFGRRYFLILGLGVSNICFACIQLSSSYGLLVASMFMYGATASFTFPMATAYLYESCERRYFAYGQTIESTLSDFACLIMPFYVEYVSKNTMVVFGISFGMQMLAFLLMFLVTEAPRYLVKSK